MDDIKLYLQNLSEPHRAICNNDIQNMTRYARQHGQEIKQQDRYIFQSNKHSIMANCSMVQNEAFIYVIIKRLHVNTRYLE